ncbi:MAG: carbon-nitrogen hydrolase family protein [Planctomycetota bacterium]|nr:carbon-nitrogen hydrolase family protein [Planctomycetota bacterium]
MTRLATIQIADLYTVTPPEANPFSDDFSPAAADEACTARLQVFEEQIDLAGADQCDLVVTAEDMMGMEPFMTFLDDPTLFRSMLERYCPVYHERLSAAARRHSMHIVACFYDLEGDDIYNFGFLYGRDGDLIGRYRKVHLPLYESWLVQSGIEFPVFETDIGKIGINICYDQMWPESTAATALNGAQIVCMPSAASPFEFRVRTRALDSQVFFITSTYAHSMIAAPNGAVLANAEDQKRGFVCADVDISAATLAPEAFYEYLYSGIRDHKERHLKFRRPQSYEPLVSQSAPLTDEYPTGGLADGEQDIRRVYEIHKTEIKKRLRGEKADYDWRW